MLIKIKGLAKFQRLNKVKTNGLRWTRLFADNNNESLKNKNYYYCSSFKLKD